MAIYHLSVKIISRSSGRSSVAAAAYRSGDILTNQWDGITHDYSRKRWIEHKEIFLPPNAPVQYKDRSTLWNAVEMIEKSGNAQLAREVEVAIPVELSPEERLQLVRDYIRETFLSKGMCVDFAIHNPPLTDYKGRPLDLNGNPTDDQDKMIFHNPHVHILLTMRPLAKDGTWEPKSHTVYLCRKGKEECSFSSEEVKQAETQGWQKQYQYKIGRKKVWLTKESGERKGLRRVSKQPKTRKELNPILQEWNSKESIFLWRERWMSACNSALRRSGICETIDHRSYEERGINQLPQVHFGHQAWQMEKKGILTSKGELNHRIRDHNRFLKTLEKQIQEMENQERADIEKTAARLEGLRSRAILYAYERICLSAIMRAIENEEQDDIARAAVLAKSLEQIVNAIDNLTKNVEKLRKELCACRSFDHKRRETLKEEILQNEKQIAALKERRKVLYESYRPLPKGEHTQPDIMRKYRERLGHIKEEQNKINQEFSRLVNKNQEYMKQLRKSCFEKRSLYMDQTKTRLKDHYKEKFSAEIWRTAQVQAPDLTALEQESLKRERRHGR